MILGDRQEAEDATQEAFARAFVALKSFRAGASCRAWLLTIVVNEARDLYTARQRRAQVLSRASARPDTSGATPSAETTAFSQRRRELLLEALLRLPATDRLVITCRYFLDLSERETADVLRVARGTVKSRLSRALARLEPILRELGPLVLVGPALHPISLSVASTDWGVARRLPLLARSVLGLGTRVSLHPRIFEDSQDRLRQVKPTPVPSGDLREQAQFLQPCDGLPRSWI